MLSRACLIRLIDLATSRRAFCGLLVALTLFLPACGDAQSSAPPAVAASDIYLTADQIVAPWHYGNPNAPTKVALQLSPGLPLDEMFFKRLYPKLLSGLTEGKVYLEFSPLVVVPEFMPVYLVALCLDRSDSIGYLNEYWAQEDEVLYGGTDIETGALRLALAHPEFYPTGFDNDQLYRRLKWCMNFRKAALTASEQTHFKNAEKWSLLSGIHQEPEPIIVINQMVFEGIGKLTEALRALP